MDWIYLSDQWEGLLLEEGFRWTDLVICHNRLFELAILSKDLFSVCIVQSSYERLASTSCGTGDGQYVFIHPFIHSLDVGTW